MNITSEIAPSTLPVVDSATMQLIIRQVMDEVLGVNRSKGKEYSGVTNALANFERLARDMNMTPEKVLWVYMTKHLDSIRSYINTLAAHLNDRDELVQQLPTLSEPITGRIMDVVAYMCLLTGQVHRRQLQEQAMADRQPANRKVLGMDLSRFSMESGEDDKGQSQPVEFSVDFAGFAEGDAELVKTIAGSVDLAQLDVPLEPKWHEPSVEELDPQQTVTLTREICEYGMLLKLLYKDGHPVAPTEFPTGAQRFRLVAAVKDDQVIIVDEHGQARTINLSTTPVFHYTRRGNLPILPVLGQLTQWGLFTSIAAAQNWKVSGIIASGDAVEGYVQQDINMDLIAARVNGCAHGLS